MGLDNCSITAVANVYRGLAVHHRVQCRRRSIDIVIHPGYTGNGITTLLLLPFDDTSKQEHRARAAPKQSGSYGNGEVREHD